MSPSVADFVCEFADKVNKKDMDELYHLWFEHLSDNIASVREHSANSIGKVMRVFGKECMERVTAHLDIYLIKVKEQPSDSKKFGELEGEGY